MSGLDLEAWAKGAGLFVLGGVIGFFLKEFMFPRLFETWKARRLLAELHRKYRDPLQLSANELASRLREVCEDYPTNFLSTDLHETAALRAQVNSADDLYFRKYKYVSSVYRFCAFLGWLEIYRQELVFLDTGHAARTDRVERSIGNIRSALADGHINGAENWESWFDRLVFREELRAVGEAMIAVDQDKKKLVMGYLKFDEIFASNTDPARRRWFVVAANFLCDVANADDNNFHFVRLRLIYVSLVNFLAELDKDRIQKRLLEYADECRKALAKVQLYNFRY